MLLNWNFSDKGQAKLIPSQIVNEVKPWTMSTSELIVRFFTTYLRLRNVHYFSLYYHSRVQAFKQYFDQVQ